MVAHPGAGDDPAAGHLAEICGLIDLPLAAAAAIDLL